MSKWSKNIQKVYSFCKKGMGWGIHLHEKAKTQHMVDTQICTLPKGARDSWRSFREKHAVSCMVAQRATCRGRTSADLSPTQNTPMLNGGVGASFYATHICPPNCFLFRARWASAESLYLVVVRMLFRYVGFRTTARTTKRLVVVRGAIVVTRRRLVDVSVRHQKLGSTAGAAVASSCACGVVCPCNMRFTRFQYFHRYSPRV
jgi:hypothetical protein